MLNEERVILMSRLASYEDGEGKQNMAVGKYFRSDYIRMQTIKSVIYATIAFVVVVALIVLMDFESFMGDIYQMDMLQYARSILFWYLGFVGIYGVISYVIYTIKYKSARKNLKIYFNNLKHLSEMNENQRPKGRSNE